MIRNTIFTLFLTLCLWANARGQALLHTFDDPTATEADFFGSSVALDGNYALISAPGDRTNGPMVGQAHLFDITTGGLLHTLDDPAVASYARFGASIALDGNYALVGAVGPTPGPDVGRAHLFDITTGGLLHSFEDPVNDARAFGASVALNGNHALIGANAQQLFGGGDAYLFDIATRELLHTFDGGCSVALDGNFALVGDCVDSTNGVLVGRASLFDVTTGSRIHTFDDPTPTEADFFGSVALAGNHALVGASGDDTNGLNAGQAHLFDIATGNLLRTFDDPTMTVQESFGLSVALQGNRALIGALGDDTNGINIGQAHLFDITTGGLLLTLNDPTITEADRFGRSVAINGDHALVGAYRDDTNGIDVGQAHLFAVPEPSGGLALLPVLMWLTVCRRTGPFRH